MICVMVDLDLESQKVTNDEYTSDPTANFRNANKKLATSSSATRRIAVLSRERG